MVVIRLVCGILQFQTFVAYMPEVSVTAVAVIGREGKVDAVIVAVFDL